MRTLIVVAMLTCTWWMDITTCSSPSGYVCHETEWMGVTTGEDNRGDRWSSSRSERDRHDHDRAAGGAEAAATHDSVAAYAKIVTKAILLGDEAAGKFLPSARLDDLTRTQQSVAEHGPGRTIPKQMERFC